MVCIRCTMFVKAGLTQLGLHFTNVVLGQADIVENITVAQHYQIRSELLKVGLDLIDDNKSVLVERIKVMVIELIHHSEDALPINLSAYLSQELHHNYAYMANIFSKTQGHSIEQFLIENKIERVKKLLIYEQLNLTEIAYKMHYSSVAHLSSQFKKVTGHTATQYLYNSHLSPKQHQIRAEPCQ